MKNMMLVATLVAVVLTTSGCMTKVRTDRVSVTVWGAGSAEKVVKALHNAPELTKSDAMGRNAYDALVSGDSESLSSIVEVTRIQNRSGGASRRSSGSRMMGRRTSGRSSHRLQEGSLVNTRTNDVEVAIFDSFGHEVARVIVPARDVLNCRLLPDTYVFEYGGATKRLTIDNVGRDAHYCHPRTKKVVETDWQIPLE